MGKYAYSLFLSKDYNKAQDIIKELSHNDPDNYIMLRLLSYMHYEKGEFDKSVETFTKFFNKVPTDKILSTDYEFYGKTLEHLNMDSLAIIQYQNVLLLDNTKIAMHETIAKLYFKNKLYANAANSFDNLIHSKQSPLPSEYFQLARSYYFAANSLNDPTDTVNKKQYFLLADSIFNIVTTLSPNSYLGYLWRARANSMLDPETSTGIAKPYYEKTLEMIGAEPNAYPKEMIEIYSYMGYYYFLKDDIQASRTYWEKILEIDPSNSKAKDALKGLN